MTTRTGLWSERHGRGPKVTGWTIDQACYLFASLINELEEDGAFQEWFGYECIDAGFVHGKLGSVIGDALLLETGRSNLWPPRTHAIDWDEDTFLDAVELLHRHVSEGVDGDYHSYGDCGWHYTAFNVEKGQRRYRERVNKILARYGSGFELSPSGQVEHKLSSQTEVLGRESPPSADPQDEELIARAVAKFKQRDIAGRRDAVRDLADVLERLRPKIKEEMFSKDEGALFEIANKFWIRHNNAAQLRDYPHDLWWDWLFHVFLASIRLVQGIAHR